MTRASNNSLFFAPADSRVMAYKICIPWNNQLGEVTWSSLQSH